MKYTDEKEFSEKELNELVICNVYKEKMNRYEVPTIKEGFDDIIFIGEDK